MIVTRSIILLFLFNLYYCNYELLNQSAMMGSNNILYSYTVNWKDVKNLVVEIKPNDYYLSSFIKYEVYCAANQKIYIDQYNTMLKTNRASIQLPQECNELGSSITIYSIVVEQQNDLKQEQFEISFKASSLASVEKICPFNCNNNTQKGICNEYTGVCKCYKYFTGQDCSFDLNVFSISDVESKINTAIKLIKEINYIGFISFKSQKTCKLVVDNIKFLSIYRVSADNYQIYEEVISPYNVVSFNIPNDDYEQLFVIQYFNNIQIPITFECYQDSNHYKLVLILCCALSIPFTIIIFVISKKLYIKYQAHKQNKQVSQNGLQNDVEHSSQNNQEYNYIKQLKKLDKSIDRPFKQLINENENFKSIICSICFQKFQEGEQVHTTQQLQIYHTTCKKKLQNIETRSNQTMLQSIFEENQQDQQQNNDNQSQPDMKVVITETDNNTESNSLKQNEDLQQLNNMKMLMNQL